MTDPTIMTNEERALLRFPGSVPGLLRRGSPVVITRRDWWGRVGDTGITSGLARPRVYSVLRDARRPGMAGCEIQQSALSLDLTDATGRAHLTWWLAEKTVRGAVPTRCTWGPSCAWQGNKRPCIHTGDGCTMVSDMTEEHCGHLNFNTDTRLLPDGSRLVDAMALSIVARHVAGLST